MKIGLIGCGKVAVDSHLPAISAVDEFDLHAIWDPDEERRLFAKDAFRAPNAFPTPEAFFACDLVARTITSPALLHAKHLTHFLRKIASDATGQAMARRTNFLLKK